TTSQQNPRSFPLDPSRFFRDDLASTLVTQSPKLLSLPPENPLMMTSAPFTASSCGGSANWPWPDGDEALPIVAPLTATLVTWISTPGLASWRALMACIAGEVDDTCWG